MLRKICSLPVAISPHANDYFGKLIIITKASQELANLDDNMHINVYCTLCEINDFFPTKSKLVHGRTQT